MKRRNLFKLFAAALLPKQLLNLPVTPKPSYYVKNGLRVYTGFDVRAICLANSLRDLLGRHDQKFLGYINRSVRERSDADSIIPI
jgi:hypothetical protein